MLSTITPCCRKCFNQNKNFYIKVFNNYVHYVYISIEYTVNSKVIKKQSPVFKPGKSEFLTFSSDASSIILRVFDASEIPPPTIWIQFSRNIKTSCYNVTGESSIAAVCVEVPC